MAGLDQDGGQVAVVFDAFGQGGLDHAVADLDALDQVVLFEELGGGVGVFGQADFQQRPAGEDERCSLVGGRLRPRSLKAIQLNTRRKIAAADPERQQAMASFLQRLTAGFRIPKAKLLGKPLKHAMREDQGISFADLREED